MHIAVIPARGASKRIGNKNIRLFFGKPIIAYSIEACLGAGRFDAVVASTDSEEIAAVARAFGAEVPFLRPGQLADDHTPVRFALEHARQWFIENRGAVASTTCVLATAPLLAAARLRTYYDDWQRSGMARGFTVCKFPYPPQRGFELHGAVKEVRPFMPQFLASRSQDLPELYHDAGLAYFRRYDRGEDPTAPFIAPGSYPIVVDQTECWDIDTEDDWRMAEALFRGSRAGT